MMQMSELLTKCGYDLVKTVYTDSSAARGMVRRTGTGRVRHIEAKYLWVQAKVRDKVLNVGIVDTEHNSADMGTKHLAEKNLAGLMRLLPVVCGKGLEPGTVQRVILMATLPLAAAAGDVVKSHAAVMPAGSAHSPFIQVLMVILMVMLAFVVGLFVGGYSRGRGEAKRLKDELRARNREAALAKLTVAELKLLVEATGMQPGTATRPLMIDHLVMHGERQLLRREAAGH